MTVIRFHPLDHRDPRIAAGIVAVQQLAYAQEAKLLGVQNFPPLWVTVHDIESSAERFFGASVDDELVGALGAEAAPDGIVIASLVVSPAWQRRGIARQLLTMALTPPGPMAATVSTGAKNAPALALYASFGFVEVVRRLLGPERIEVVTLRRDG